MQDTGNSRTIFIFDLMIIYSCFAAVYSYLHGIETVPVNGVELMLGISVFWFFISINSKTKSFTWISLEV